MAVGRGVFGQNRLGNAAVVLEEPAFHPGTALGDVQALLLEYLGHRRIFGEAKLLLEFGQFQIKPVHRVDSSPRFPLA